MALLATFILVFVAQAAPRISAPFGDSHDGENGATWAFASKAIRDDGFFGSRAGSDLADGQGLYAHHPPLIATETAVVEAIAGQSPATTRAPAWLGSIAAIVLLYLLLRALQLRRVPSAVGVWLALSCPMFLLYGSMLDTLQISLPIALAFLVARAHATDTSSPRAGLVAALAALTVLSSWEGVLLCAAFSALDVVTARQRQLRLRFAPTVVGSAAGLGVLAAWLFWSAGSFTPIAEQFFARSEGGSKAVGWSGFLEFQNLYLGALIGPVIILAGGIGLVIAIRAPRTRCLVLVTTAVPLFYAVGLRDGAVNHDYWNYWLLIPLAISIATLTETALVWLARRYASERLALGVALTLCVATLVVALPDRTPAASQFNEGLTAAKLVTQMSHASPGPLYMIGHYDSDERWADYSLPSTSKPSRVLTADALMRAADRHPNAPVLVKCVRRPHWLDPFCEEKGRVLYALVRLAAVTATSVPRPS